MNNDCEFQPRQIVSWITYWGTPNPPQQTSNHNHSLECSANQLNQAIRSDANVIRNDQQFPYAIGKYTTREKSLRKTSFHLRIEES